MIIDTILKTTELYLRVIPNKESAAVYLKIIGSMGIRYKKALHILLIDFTIGINSHLAALNIFKQAAFKIEYLCRFHLLVLETLLDQMPV